MYVSTLLINVGDDPDRPRPGRLWLRNLYRVHQRLCMAFPSAPRKSADRDFLAPYDPSDFPEDRYLADGTPSEVPADVLRQVHTKRNDKSGFLFRIDPQPGGRVTIVVLSSLLPNWDYAFGLTPGRIDPRTGRPLGNAGYLLAAHPSEPRRLRVEIVPGALFRFALVANPVFRARARSPGSDGKCIDAKWVGKRVPVTGDESSLRNWLERRAVRAGFNLKEVTLIHRGFVYVNRTREAAGGKRLRSARYEGTLEITDPEKFRAALSCGIGPAKAFGFGLLSIAPVK
jgi:CRISPR system Cascade subunit CasE